MKASIWTVPAETVSTVIVPANTARRSISLFNDSPVPAYVSLSPTAEVESADVVVYPDSIRELSLKGYKGEISCVYPQGGWELHVSEVSE